MPTTFANTIDGNDIYAKRAECDAAGNTISSTYATKSEVPTVDQIYDSTSANAQSGVAMAGALSGKQDSMVVLEYGTSTWAEFLAAYNNNAIVYCRVLTNTKRWRLAHMAYINLYNTPNKVEFWFARSIDMHSATQQCDQVIVYALDSSNTWTTTTRDMVLQATAGTGITRTVTTSAGAGTIEWSVTNPVPDVTSSDDGKILKATYSGGVGSFSWENESAGGVTDVEVDGTSVVSGGIASITMPTELVPNVTSSDDGKVLKATYSGGAGSYSWETESGGGGTQVQSDWTEDDPSEVSYIQNKPLDIGITEGTGITFTNSGASVAIGVTIPVPSFDPNNDVGKVLKITSGGVLAWVTP